MQDAARNPDALASGRHILGLAGQLDTALQALVDAAQFAAFYRAKADLTVNVGTKIGLLFPRAAHPEDPTRGGERATPPEHATTHAGFAPTSSPIASAAAD